MSLTRGTIHKGQAFYKMSHCFDDERKKFKCFFESAKSGDEAGMASLGYCYISGSGCKTDANKGFHLLKTVADRDNAIAIAVCETLAGIYGGHDKETGEKYMDKDKAIQYAKKARESGSLNVAYILGNLYLDNGNAKQGLRILKDAAQKGNINAMVVYGFGLLEQGENEEGLNMLKQAYDCGEHDTKEFLKPYIDEMEKRQNTIYKEDNEMNAEERSERIIKMKEDIAAKKGLEIAEGLVDEIINKSSNITMELAVYACARAMVQLVTYQYRDRDGEIDESFFEALKRARFLAVTELVPCISKPMPCGKCRACRNGEWEYCTNKKVDESLLKLSNIAMLSESLIDYIIQITTMAVEKNK